MREDHRSVWEGNWVYRTRRSESEREVVVVDFLEMQLFMEQKITEGYRAGFRDAVKTMPIVQKATNNWEFKE